MLSSPLLSWSPPPLFSCSPPHAFLPFPLKGRYFSVLGVVSNWRWDHTAYESHEASFGEAVRSLQWLPCVLCVLTLSILLLLGCSCGSPEVGGPSITQARHRTHLSKCADSLDQFLGMLTTITWALWGACVW